MNEHLAGKLFSNVKYPNSPWAFWGLSVSLVDKGEDDEETQESLNYLDEGYIRACMSESDELYARGRLGRGDDKSVCRCQGSHRGLHCRGMRVVGEMAFDAP